jgi:multisubunit Na+/H+ antiporter MnhB subunit
MMRSLILSTATRFLMPVILLLAVFVFWRGHNEPGGGFVGGLLAATAFALLEKAEGLKAARNALRFRPQSLAATGLGCALVSGVWGGLAYGYFLKGVWPLLTIQPDGSKSGLPFGSIFLFDLGVFLVVLGAVCGILFALEEAVASETDHKRG